MVFIIKNLLASLEKINSQITTKEYWIREIYWMMQSLVEQNIYLDFS